MVVTEEKLTGVNFETSENQNMIAQMIRDFGNKEIKPKMMDWDESQSSRLNLKNGPISSWGFWYQRNMAEQALGYPNMLLQ